MTSEHDSIRKQKGSVKLTHREGALVLLHLLAGGQDVHDAADAVAPGAAHALDVAPRAGAGVVAHDHVHLQGLGFHPKRTVQHRRSTRLHSRLQLSCAHVDAAIQEHHALARMPATKAQRMARGCIN